MVIGNVWVFMGSFSVVDLCVVEYVNYLYVGFCVVDWVVVVGGIMGGIVLGFSV